MLSTQEDSNGLSGTAWYRYIESRDPVTLHGQKLPNGDFRPVATFEVATEGKAKWKQIHPTFSQPAPDIIIVSPEHPAATLSVNMEPFRPAIGTFRYARLVLENGDATIFELDNLLPTSDESDTGDGDFKVDVLQTDQEKNQAGITNSMLTEESVDLSCVTSLGGRLIGDLVLSARSAKPINLDGTRTVDGDLWANATFQVANSDMVWKTIGKSKNSGTLLTLQIPIGRAKRIRVQLTDFRPFIGKFKYGKVIFSNGHFGVFLLDHLKPRDL